MKSDAASGINKVFWRPKETCADCHFFEFRRILRGTNLDPEVVRADDRGKAKTNNFDWAPEDTEVACNQLGCHMGVWREGYKPNGAKEDRFRIIVETDRRGFCFFLPYHEGMRFEAAETLQRRKSELYEAARDRRLTVIGLWIAAIALVANVLMEFCKR